MVQNGGGLRFEQEAANALLRLQPCGAFEQPSEPRAQGRPLAVAMLDVDHFKRVNDSYGHLAGDEVLQELCRRVRGELRQDELLARYGGEEFAVLMCEASLEQACHVAERLRQALQGGPLVTEQAAVEVTISLGVAAFPGKGTITAAQLLKRADEQLYAAKRAGRNRVCG